MQANSFVERLNRGKHPARWKWHLDGSDAMPMALMLSWGFMAMHNIACGFDD
jgi:hypothetical protein